MLTIPFKFLFKTAYVQLRLHFLPFREPDPRQKCLQFLLTFFSKLFIFSSGCLPSLSGSRTRARNANISFRSRPEHFRRSPIALPKKDDRIVGSRPEHFRRSPVALPEKRPSYRRIPPREFYTVPSSSARQVTIVSSDPAQSILEGPQ